MYGDGLSSKLKVCFELLHLIGEALLSLRLRPGSQLWNTRRKSLQSKSQILTEFDCSKETSMLLSLKHLSAKELTIMCCTTRAMDTAASHPFLWKALWRLRYDRILWSVPNLLRHVDVSCNTPMQVFRECFLDLGVAPCWWGVQSETPYTEQLASYEQRFGKQKQWKLFYFAFGMHWPKWAVAEHSTADDCWMVIHGTIFNMTDFHDHPGGPQPFQMFAGLDSTEAFEAIGHSWSDKTAEFGDRLIVPELQLSKEGTILTPTWLLKQEAVPTWKRLLFALMLFDVHRELSYHDFW